MKKIIHWIAKHHIIEIFITFILVVFIITKNGLEVTKSHYKITNSDTWYSFIDNLISGVYFAVFCFLFFKFDQWLERKCEDAVKLSDDYSKLTEQYYYDRLLYSTGDAVPAILSGIKVNYTDKKGNAHTVVNTAKWPAETTVINGADYPLEKISLDEGEKDKTTYPIWDGRNETIKELLASSETLLTESWKIEADLTKKMKITYVYVTPKTQTTQINYVDVKSGDKTTTHFLFTDNEKDKFSSNVEKGLSTALHKVTSMLK